MTPAQRHLAERHRNDMAKRALADERMHADRLAKALSYFLEGQEDDPHENNGGDCDECGWESPCPTNRSRTALAAHAKRRGKA